MEEPQAPPDLTLTGDDILYPQSYPFPKVRAWIDGAEPWAAERARALLEERPLASPHVRRHWELLAAYEPDVTESP